MKEHICSNCIQQEYFRDYIRQNGKISRCSYCYSRKKTIDFDSLIEDILEGIEFIYDDPANGLGYVEGEYVKGNGDIVDTYDLLMDELEFGGSPAFQDIIDSLPMQLWCKKDFYGLDSAEERIYTWEQFVNQVKYKTRYFFIQDKSDINKHLPFNKPYEILYEFATAISRFGMIEELKSGDFIYRARLDNKKKYKTPKELGTPKPENCLKPNRMSPAGIPMFYGSKDKVTCIVELRSEKGHYTIGKWTPTKKLRILNLTKDFGFNTHSNLYYYKDFPSIFDKDNRDFIFDYQFILKFASDLSSKVDDNIANINYVPTQIVAEFLRKVALFDDKSLDGICFYSSINGGKNYALFIEQEECYKSKGLSAFEQKIELLSTEEYENKSA